MKTAMVKTNDGAIDQIHLRDDQISKIEVTEGHLYFYRQPKHEFDFYTPLIRVYNKHHWLSMWIEDNDNSN